jgi:hypothetical protein
MILILYNDLFPIDEPSKFIKIQQISSCIIALALPLAHNRMAGLDNLQLAITEQ